MCTRYLLASLPLAVASTVWAQDHVHPTGAAEKVGTVHFETSCNPRVAPQFDRAVALLHSFEFRAAISGFNQVLAADSSCAMAHWGIALSRWSNPMAIISRPREQLMQGRLASEAALLLAPRATGRERGYISAVTQLYKDFESVPQADRVLAYERAMADVVAANPGDSEAKAFYAISLVAAAAPEDKTYAKQKKAGDILEPLWVKQPNHPGLAHYIIHTYDYPMLAAEAAEAARLYSSIAPSAAHALHMPSHIFTRTGLWRESVETNRRSMAIARSTGAISEMLHAADYAVYAYMQMGQHAAVKSILDSLPGFAARFDPNAVTGAATGPAGIFALAAIPARYAVEREAWQEAIGLVPGRHRLPWVDAMTYFVQALGASHLRNFATARTAIDSLAAFRDRLAAIDESYWSEQVAIQHLAARAWLDLAEGRTDSALAGMREAARREDATEKSAITPGPLVPARELLGDMLMQSGQPKDALSEYQRTLEKEPNRYRSLAGGLRAAKAAGDNAAAAKFTGAIARARQTDEPRP